MLIATNTLAGALLAAAGALGCPETCETGVAAVPAPAPTVFFSPALAPAQAVAGENAGRYFFVKKDKGEGAAKSDGRTNISVVNDDGAFSLTMKDGAVVEAKVDGEPIPMERVIREGEVIRFVDEDGDELVEFHVGPDGALWFGEGEKFEFSPDVMAFGLAEAAEPRPMIGVTLESVSNTVADQLGLDPEEVVVITSVTEGLPAHKAGIERSDIVVKIDGETPATEDRLREVILSRKAGDKLRLGIIRKGKPQEITIEIEEVRPQGAIARVPGANHEGMQWRGAFEPEAQRKMIAEIQRAAEQARKAGRDASRAAAEEARQYGQQFRMYAQDTRQLLEEVRDRMRREYEKLDLKITEEDKQKLREALERVTRAIEEMDVNIDAPRLKIFRGDGPRAEALIAPAPPAPPSPPALPSAPSGMRQRTPMPDDRLDRLEERMDRIQELLEKLAEEKNR